jgi:hypothetical protein
MGAATAIPFPIGLFARAAAGALPPKVLARSGPPPAGLVREAMV